MHVAETVVWLQGNCWQCGYLSGQWLCQGASYFFFLLLTMPCSLEYELRT